MNSVERIKYYINGPKEAPPISDVRPPPNWPQNGAITFDNVVMSYREGTGKSKSIHVLIFIPIRTGSSSSRRNMRH